MFNKVISNSFLAIFFLFLQVSRVQGEEQALCEVLQTSFFGSAPVQVQCGEGPEGLGWISNDAKIQKIALRLRDQETGQERMLFQSTRTGPNKGGTGEGLFINATNWRWRNGERVHENKPMSIGLLIPGGCGSNKIFNTLTFDLFRDDKKFLEDDEECSWLNENDSNWRTAVSGIGENEDVLYIRYALEPSTPVYYDKDGKEEKGFLSTFYVQSSRDDFYCESLEDPLFLFFNSNRCETKKTVPMCIGRSAWCSAPNAREHFEFLKYGCKALPDGSCPSITDCILGEDSFYSHKEYVDQVAGISTGVKKYFYNFDKESKPSQSGSGLR